MSSISCSTGTKTKNVELYTPTAKDYIDYYYKLAEKYGNNPEAIAKISSYAKDAIFANNAYLGESYYKTPTGYEIINTETYGSNDFSVSTFINKSTGEVVVSFRGTANNTNILQDASMILGSVLSPDIYAKAINYIKNIKSKIELENTDVTSAYFGAKTVVLTGHSLGGALATYAGMSAGYDVITFNSAPLTGLATVLPTIGATKYGIKNIINFKAITDPLTTIDSVALPGETITVSNAWGGPGLFGGHSIKELMKSMLEVQSAVADIGVSGLVSIITPQ